MDKCWKCGIEFDDDHAESVVMAGVCALCAITEGGIEVRRVSEEPQQFAATTEKISPMYCLGASAHEAESKAIAADKAAWSRAESERADNLAGAARDLSAKRIGFGEFKRIVRENS